MEDTTMRRHCLLARLIILAVVVGLGFLSPGLSSGSGPVLTLSPTSDINPIGTTHTVDVTLSDVPNICKTPGGTATNETCTDNTTCKYCEDNTTPCDVDAECTVACSETGACDVSGYPVFCDVISGPNASATTTVGNSGATDSTGKTTCSYDGTTVGTDTIRVCADSDVDIDADFDACVADTGDIYRDATKSWLENYGTGGFGFGGTTASKKPKQTGGGNVGADPAPTGGCLIQWTIADHPNKLVCHANSCENLVFDCNTGNTPCVNSPPSNANVVDVDISGTCNDGTAFSGHLHLEDIGEPGKDVDKIRYANSTGNLASFGLNTISQGNLQVHQIILE
jgi:hypothetical protein